MFPQILYVIVLYARHFLPVKFFPEYYLNSQTMFRAAAKCSVDRSGVDPGFFLGGGATLTNDVTDGEIKKF